jgi:STE24 endopeptidase
MAAKVVHAPRARQRCFGLWRALAATPAMFGSLMLLLVAFGWMGRWEGLVLFGWLVAGSALCTRVGERVAVRTGCKFRCPTAAQRQLLEAPWASALSRCGVAVDAVDCYIRQDVGPNACAAGARSVAVTSGILDEFQTGRISERAFQAVLVHELGHHATHASRFSLVTIWLTAPWRTAAWFTLGLVPGLVGRRHPMQLVAATMAFVLGLTIAQGVHHGAWMTVAIIGGVPTLGVMVPLIDAAISRASERAADQYAADAGIGDGLVEALRAMNSRSPCRLPWPARLLALHPPIERRIAVLVADD